MICVVVPLKPFSSAKTRLGARLDAAQRAALAEVSAARVLRMLERHPGIDRRLAVVEDEAAARLAESHYFEVVKRSGLWGQSAAVDAGFDLAREAGAGTLLTISADVPLAEGEDVDRLLGDPGPVLVMVTDRAGVGTNALRLTPARPFRLHFGDGSLAKHRREAEFIDLPVKVLNLPRVRLDLDTPDDIDALEKSGPEGRQVLIDAGLLERDRRKVAAETSVREDA